MELLVEYSFSASHNENSSGDFICILRLHTFPPILSRGHLQFFFSLSGVQSSVQGLYLHISEKYIVHVVNMVAKVKCNLLSSPDCGRTYNSKLDKNKIYNCRFAALLWFHKCIPISSFNPPQQQHHQWQENNIVPARCVQSFTTERPPKSFSFKSPHISRFRFNL